MTDARVIESGCYYETEDGSEMVVVTRIDDDGDIHYNRGSESFSWTVDEFADHYTRLVEDGPGRQAARMAALMAEMSQDTLDAAELQSQMAALATPTAALLGSGNSTAGTGVPQVEEMKRTVAGVRNEVQKTQLRMQKRSDEMMSLVKEQAAAVEGMMAGLSAMVEKAQETIWTFNLYLGKDEVIELLRDGAPAQDAARITLMQKVLYMDEESTLDADEDGMDARSIKEFTEWLLAEPKHLDQLIPRERSIVAIKPRRERKRYNDAWTQEAMDKANRHTYFLIRNGEKLYLIDTDLEVGETLFPRADDFVQMFGSADDPLKPGSKEYMEAMAKAEGLQQHYLRVFLFLQGLLDRTPVFAPFEVPRVNVFDMNRQDEHIEFFRDAEEKTLLTTGRPTFDEWLEEVNSGMTVGHRVMGFFHQYNDSRNEENRISPRSAQGPSSEKVYVLTKPAVSARYSDSSGAFIFLYERDDTVAKKDRWGGHTGYDKAERRASYKLYTDDDNILCFDRATVEDMEYYLASRTNRKAYARMVPVLTRAIALKKQEIEDEKPFKLLLTGQLISAYDIYMKVAEEAVDTLVPWWKFKNTTHRALTSDDLKALDMIVAEYGIRLKRQAERSVVSKSVIEPLLATHPEALFIGHKSENDFVVLIPHNSENVFVQEEVWRNNSNGLKRVERRTWRTVDKRRLRWEELYTSDRWTTWKLDAVAKEYLTDPERIAFIADAFATLRRRFDKAANETHERDRYGKREFVPLTALIIPAAQLIQVWALQNHTQLPPDDRVATGKVSEGTFIQVDVAWTRKKTGIVPDFGYENTYIQGSLSRVVGEQSSAVVLWRDDAALKRVSDELNIFNAFIEGRHRLTNMQWPINNQVSREAEKRVEAAELNKFLAEYGDIELWPTHLKSLRLRNISLHLVGQLALYLLEQGIDINGMTVIQILTKGWKRKCQVTPARKKSDDDFDDDEDSKEKPDWSEYPLDLVITMKKPNDEEEKEEEDADDEEES